MNRRERGFSLLELAVVLGVMGFIGAAAMGLNGMSGKGSRGGASGDAFTQQVHLQRIAQAVIGFARRNHRLPCPDTDGDALEDCGTAGVLGGLPFLTLEVGLSGAAGSALARSFMYGLYRAPDVDADLGVLEERTGEQKGDLGYLGRNDLVMALRNAHQASGSEHRLRVAGPQSTGASSACGSDWRNVAFVLAVSASRDADRLASPSSDFDGANGHLVWPTGGATSCVENPAVGQSEHYDDTVIAVGFTELLGYLIR